MELSEIRREIDEIDDELLRLFLRRMVLSKKIAEYKRVNALPIFDAARECEILADAESKSDNMSKYAVQLFAKITELSRAYQEALCDE